MRGSGAVGLGVAAALIVGLVLFPALVVAGFYAFANAYALVVGSDFSAETVNVGVLLAGLVLTVAVLLALLAAGVGLLGRSLSPRRRGAEDSFGALDP